MVLQLGHKSFSVHAFAVFFNTPVDYEHDNRHKSSTFMTWKHSAFSFLWYKLIYVPSWRS